MTLRYNRVNWVSYFSNLPIIPDAKKMIFTGNLFIPRKMPRFIYNSTL